MIKAIPEIITIVIPRNAIPSGCSSKKTKPNIKANKTAVYLNGEMKEISPDRMTKTAV